MLLSRYLNAAFVIYVIEWKLADMYERMKFCLLLSVSYSVLAYLS